MAAQGQDLANNLRTGLGNLDGAGFRLLTESSVWPGLLVRVDLSPYREPNRTWGGAEKAKSPTEAPGPIQPASTTV